MEARFDEAEKACAKRLAELHEKGVVIWSRGLEDNPTFALNLPPETKDRILRTMEHFGIISEVASGRQPDEQFIFFKITGKAIQVVREIAEEDAKSKEKGDIVEEIKEKARRHPVTARLLILFLVLTAAVTLANQLIQLLQNLGLLTKP